MATVLDLVKHYQHAIEKYPNDEHKVLVNIEKLFNLNVTVQHLQETGVGRTVNALRKEAGVVGHAARALVYKWKLMVAAEESDQDTDHNNDTTTHSGHENGKDSDDSARKQSKIKQERHDETNSSVKTENKSINGHYSGSKRKYRSSEEEEPDTKKRKDSSNNDSYHQKANIHVKKDASESESDDSLSSESNSESSEYSEDEQEGKPTDKVKQKSPDQHKSKHLLPHKNHIDHKKESSSSKKANDSDKHSKSRHQSESIDKKSSDKSYSKEKSHSSDNHKSSKDNDSSSSKKKSKSEHSSSKKDKKHNVESSSSKQKSSSDKHKSSKSDSSNEKHISNTEKHSRKSDKRKSSSHSHKSDNDKQKSSAEKDVSGEKHKSKDSSNRSSKEKHSSSSKERSKDRSSSSKEKSDHSHKSEKKHSSSDSKLKQSDSKHKSGKKDEGSGETKSKHKSRSLSSHTDKSSSSKSKEEVPKKKAQDSGADSDEGINCGSGASFAEALGMISPVKPKKKSKTSLKDAVSPNTSANEDLSPASLLAPTAKLAPLPALEISALPEISPHYKPRPPPKLLPHFTDDEALNHSISSKNQRTKVYSGNKVIGKIPSLYEMCVTVLQEHIDALEYTGGVPYDILKPVVDRATPQQLFMLEHYNPYLMEDTDHLWQKFCEKHFRNKQRQELETWREMYMRCQEEQEHRLKSLTANIRIAQEAKKAPIKQTKMAYVDTVVKPPRNIARKQALHGTAHSASASPAARVASLAAAPNVLRGSARPSPSAPAPFNQKPKKAPLMQKALQFMRGRKR